MQDKSTKDIGITRIAPHNVYIGESLTEQNCKLFNQCLEQEKWLKYYSERMNQAQ